MSGHLWFLSEELMALALFDNKVKVSVKDQVVAVMNIVDGEETSLKRATVNIEQ